MVPARLPVDGGPGWAGGAGADYVLSLSTPDSWQPWLVLAGERSTKRRPPGSGCCPGAGLLLADYCYLIDFRAKSSVTGEPLMSLVVRV